MKIATMEEVGRGRGAGMVLDVRTPAEYEEVHIPGSVLVPLQELKPEEVRRLGGAEQDIFVVCRSGTRAKQACSKLEGAGFDRVSVLEGGMQAWEAAGGEVNRGRAAMSLERQVRIAAGGLVVAGVVLGLTTSRAWFGLSGFVGAGLVFAGVTDSCGMGMVLARMPWNRRRTGKPAVESAGGGKGDAPSTDL